MDFLAAIGLIPGASHCILSANFLKPFFLIESG